MALCDHPTDDWDPIFVELAMLVENAAEEEGGMSIVRFENIEHLVSMFGGTIVEAEGQCFWFCAFIDQCWNVVVVRAFAIRDRCSSGCDLAVTPAILLLTIFGDETVVF